MHFRFKKRYLKSLLICTFFSSIYSAYINPVFGFYGSGKDKTLIIEKKNEASGILVPLKNSDKKIKKEEIVSNNANKKSNTIFLKRKGFVELKGPKISVSFKDIPAKDALQAIAKLGGYGYIYIPNLNKKTQNNKNSQDNKRLINLNFSDEIRNCFQ